MRIRMALAGVVVACAAAFMASGCGLTSQQANDMAEKVQAVTTQAAEASAQIDAALVQVRATTQPTATMPTITPEAIAQEAKAEKILIAAKEKIEAARKAGSAIAPVIVAVAQGENPGPAIIGAAPAAGAYGIWVTLGGIAVSLGWGISQAIAKKKAVAAGASAVDAIQQAIAAGQIAVTNAQAAATVDSRAESHPNNDRLVDVLAAAPVEKK